MKRKEPMPSLKKALFHYIPVLAAFVGIGLSAGSCALRAGSLERAQPQEAVKTVSGCLPEDCAGPLLSSPAACDGTDTGFRYDASEPALASAWRARASFLLGIAALDSRQAELSLTYLKEAHSLDDILDYVMYYEARALSAQGRQGDALSVLDSFLSSFKDSALLADALYLRAVALFDSGDFKSAAEAFSAFVDEQPKNQHAPDALIGLARASFETGDRETSAKAVKRILTRHPAHHAAKDADALVSMLRLAGIPVELTPGERLERAEGFFDALRYREAALEFSNLLKLKNGELYDRALVRLAVSRIRLKDYEQAQKTLADYLNGRNPQRELDALYWLSIIAVRQGDEGLLLDIEKTLSEKFPKDALRARVLVFIGRFYESAGLHERSAEAFDRVLRDFRQSPAFEDALWSRAWVAYTGARYYEAYRIFSEYPGGGEANRFLYWKGRSAERLGNLIEAAGVYRGLCAEAPSNYYCKAAQERLDFMEDEAEHAAASFNALACVEPYSAQKEGDGALCVTGPEDIKDAAAEEDPLAPAEAAALKVNPPEGLFVDRHYLAARELLLLGLNAKASAELDMLAKRYQADYGALYELARLFNEARDFHNALRIYQRLAGLKGRSQGTGQAYFSFPLSVVEMIKENSRTDEVDPYLIAAVMREESSFNPRAISATGALGLMQLMPSTALAVASELGEDGFEPKELFDPDTNIRFGSWYLGALSRRFNNDIVLTVAGYNAGPHAVERWMKRLPYEPDEFIESIPYPETRAYAKKVLKSYAEYLRVAGLKAEIFKRPLPPRPAAAADKGA